MTKRMLIDATHAEETRVVVLDGSRLEDFDVETANKKQLKGNIYLAKVVRVEPSLQAAFVEYGGNRHGFLAFSEIHPDYYQIPVADRQRLIEMQLEDARHEAEEEDRAAEAAAAGTGEQPDLDAEPPTAEEIETLADVPLDEAEEPAGEVEAVQQEQEPAADPEAGGHEVTPAQPLEMAPPETMIAPESVPADHVVAHLGEAPAAPETTVPETTVPETTPPEQAEASAPAAADEQAVADPEAAGEAAAIAGETGKPAAADGDEIVVEPFDEDAPAAREVPEADDDEADADEEPPPPESLGGDTVEEPRERRIPPRFLRNYKIQEVIKRRQILLIQVVKEERGTKGAALTTYISLAGRYSVLMPNSPRGGGISRKITSATDRRRLKEVMTELDLPRGMGLIVRTAGANRPKPEIKRDCEYLLRLWDDIREHTMRSVAPALIYEEANLIKRAIRDVYSRDVDEIMVDGEQGWKAAHDFMRMMMPSHASKVRMWREPGQALFSRHGVEAQLDGMLRPTVQLRSGGYLVINQAEALVAIDVNSGRSTRERNIEETALRTNLEAADEAARQLRLRDLAGLIVIDFIDMESRRHNAMVERRLKEALKHDRARIQVGQISHFGLLEMSRQRLRPSLAETSMMVCPHCGGTGHVRNTETAALHVLRQVEEEGAKRRAAEIVVHVAGAVAMYILNHKRQRLAEIEARYDMQVTFAADERLIAPETRIERVRAAVPSEAPAPIQVDQPLPVAAPEPEEAAETGGGEEDAEERAAAEDDGGEDGDRRRRRRRRRRGGRREEADAGAVEAGAGESAAEEGAKAAEPTPPEEPPAGEDSDLGTRIEGVPEFAEPAPVADQSGEVHAEAAEGGEGAGRRRGRRGGRRRRRTDDAALAAIAEPGAEQPDVPSYTGPTPADPFGGQDFDIFAALEKAEQAAVRTASAPAAEPANPDTIAEPVAAELAMTEPAAEAGAELGAEVVTPAEEAVPAATSAREEETAEAVTEAVPAPEITEAAADESVAQELAAAEAAPAEPAAIEPAPAEPAVRPIVVGVDEVPGAEKKRGWWRR